MGRTGDVKKTGTALMVTLYGVDPWIQHFLCSSQKKFKTETGNVVRSGLLVSLCAVTESICTGCVGCHKSGDPLRAALERAVNKNRRIACGGT